MKQTRTGVEVTDLYPRTKDGVEYQPGMTLYSECLGVVTERPTTGMVADCDHEYASGVRRSEYIPSSYARHEEALRAAVSYWLKIKLDAQDKINALNKTRNELVLGRDA